MTFATTPLHPDFGARVHGRDLTRRLDPAEAADVLDLLAEHGVLLFPGQTLEPADEVAFAAALNEVRRPHGAAMCGRTEGPAPCGAGTPDRHVACRRCTRL